MSLSSLSLFPTFAVFQFVADSGNVGSRTYLLAPDEENYYMFYLKNRSLINFK